MKRIRDTPEIVIPKGYTPEEFLDMESEGYEFGDPILKEEVKIEIERVEKE